MGFCNLALELIVNPLPELGAELVQRVACMSKFKQLPRKNLRVIPEKVHLHFVSVKRSLESINHWRDDLSSYVGHQTFPDRNLIYGCSWCQAFPKVGFRETIEVRTLSGDESL
jgi:hypothetical protein